MKSITKPDHMGRRIAAIIRHGDYQQIADSPSALQPYPLNVKGEQQAATAATTIEQLLLENQWQLVPTIDSSQQLRGWQSAHIILTALSANGQQNLQIESFDALAERSTGAAANLTTAQIRTVIENDPRYPELPQGWKSDSRFRLPLQGAESLLEAGLRVARHLSQRLSTLPIQEQEQEQEQDQLKLFVGHGAAFRHAAYHLGVLKFSQIAKLSMYHCTPILLEQQSDDCWRQIGGEWKIRNAGSEYRD
ncbi:MAG TPA: hypothetical protein HPP65_14040 [Gammaproteobacteria bacterium]|jgi:2,3-bisphosphoglycerate-dependent phosphoglycerate mutase|nr:hypothetical protein [Gammaproteobacteria bacterium]MBT3844734.1 hypothetical protein [Gammaproteobacteria bacterium]MBT3893846.1 hypothetical protein [Gammaproteobacteria bacterium]MBT4549544.1 hypothetical protein [Gammaproteobacteria bacterium]MBT5370467.1 hypothetical protein [Gammaproteobacteria bacterium]